MNRFSWQPSDGELDDLTKMAAHPGYRVFTELLRQVYNESSAKGVKELGGGNPDAMAPGYWAGYLQCLEDVINMVDTWVANHRRDVEQKLSTQRLIGSSTHSAGDTAS